MELHNRVVQLKRFGDPDGLEVVDTPLPTAGPGEVRVHVLASGLEYTDTLIRRHLYPQTASRRPPFVMGYDVVGEIDQLGEGVSGFQPGDRVADMTVVGANAAYRTLSASDLTRVPTGVDPAELWGGANGTHAALIRELGATPIDYQREDFARVLPDGFDVVFDGIGEDGYRHSFASLKRGGLLCAYGYSAGVRDQERMLTMLMWIARLYLWSWLPGGKRAGFYSINAMRLQHPPGSGKTWSICSLCWPVASFARACPSGSRWRRSPRHTAVLKLEVSRASSCFAQICRTGGRLARVAIGDPD
jgi:NADPH:quinone reductase